MSQRAFSEMDRAELVALFSDPLNAQAAMDELARRIRVATDDEAVERLKDRARELGLME
jgi:hypothetical protein